VESGLIAVIGLVASIVGTLLMALAHRRELVAAKREIGARAVASIDRDAEKFLKRSPSRMGHEATARVFREVQLDSDFVRRAERRALTFTTADSDELRTIFREELEKYGKAQRDDDRKAERRALFLDFLQNAVFFALGVGATLLISG
jgi:hypothetical protein